MATFARETTLGQSPHELVRANTTVAATSPGELSLVERVKALLSQAEAAILAAKGYGVGYAGMVTTMLPRSESQYEDNPKIVFAELIAERLPITITLLQEAGLYVEFCGAAEESGTGSSYNRWQLVHIEEAPTLGQWLEKHASGLLRVVNRTGWKDKGQLERLVVVGFYGQTTRLSLRRKSPSASAYDGHYYFLKFERQGRGQKAREIAERDKAFDFGKLNPYLYMEKARYSRLDTGSSISSDVDGSGKENMAEFWKRIWDLESELNYESYTVSRQRRYLFYHLYAETRRREREKEDAGC